jgi:hypothetical protein
VTICSSLIFPIHYLLLTIGSSLTVPIHPSPSHRLLLRPPGSHYLHRTRLGLGIAAVSGLARSRPRAGGLVRRPADDGAFDNNMGTSVSMGASVPRRRSYQDDAGFSRTMTTLAGYRTMTALASALDCLPHCLALTILPSLSCSHYLALTILLSLSCSRPRAGDAGAAPVDGAD